MMIAIKFFLKSIKLFSLVNCNFLIATIILITQVFTEPASANYKPPKNQKPPTTYTESSGVRGGCQYGIDATAITLLAPVKHVGQTISQYPKLAWFIDETTSIPIELSLYKFGVKENPKLIYKQVINSSPGTNQFQIPTTSPGLQMGHHYMWQLQTRCNYNRPSHDLVLRAEIERVAIPLPVLHALNGNNPVATAQSKTLSDLVQVYAMNGLWYDALAQALTISSSKHVGAFAAELISQLAKVEGEWQRVNLTRITMDLL